MEGGRSGGRAKRPPIEHTDPVSQKRKLRGFHYIFPSERSSSWRQEEGAGAPPRLACSQQFRERRRRTLSFPNSPILSPSKPYLVLGDNLCYKKTLCSNAALAAAMHPGLRIHTSRAHKAPRTRTHDRRCAKTSDTRSHASNNPVHATHPGLCL